MGRAAFDASQVRRRSAEPKRLVHHTTDNWLSTGGVSRQHDPNKEVGTQIHSTVFV